MSDSFAAGFHILFPNAFRVFYTRCYAAPSRNLEDSLDSDVSLRNLYRLLLKYIDSRGELLQKAHAVAVYAQNCQ